MVDQNLRIKLTYQFRVRTTFFGLICCALFLIMPCAFAQINQLSTKSEQSIGITLASYKYDEPGYMTLKANKVGIDFSGTYSFGSQWPYPEQSWFVHAELQALNGKADYQSSISGSIDNTPNRSVEARALVGKDLALADSVLAAYVGLGYRHLYSNIGYKRSSTYTTLPIGITHKMRMSEQAQLHTTVEYMHLLSGNHKVNLPSQEVTLDQKRGHGLRLSVMHRQNKWSVGPTVTYWNMAQSEVGGTLPISVYEPKNKTMELGIKGAMRF